MVIHEAGHNPDTTITQYQDPTTVRIHHVYLYDAGTGEIIAEFAPDVATIIHNHPDQALTLTYDGHGHITRTETPT